MRPSSKLMLAGSPDKVFGIPEPISCCGGNETSHQTLASLPLESLRDWFTHERFLEEMMRLIDIGEPALLKNSLIVLLLDDSEHRKAEDVICRVAVDETPYMFLCVVLSNESSNSDPSAMDWIIETPQFARIRLADDQLMPLLRGLIECSAKGTDWTGFLPVKGLLIKQGVVDEKS